MFLVYIGILFGFAAIYYQLYSKNPHNFVFNSEILAAQSETYKSSAENQIASYSLVLDLLRHLMTQMENGVESPNKTGKWYDSDHTVQFTTIDYKYFFSRHSYPVAGHFPPPQPTYKLQVTDTNGHEITSIELPAQEYVKLPQSIAECRDLTKNLIATFGKELAETQRRLRTLSTRTPDVWSFWDFLYFSTITQTTVGYGDVLPNSTLVRVVVMIQLTIGTALLVVVINLVFSRRPRDS